MQFTSEPTKGPQEFHEQGWRKEAFKFVGFSKAFTCKLSYLNIVYVMESAAYGVLFTSCLCLLHIRREFSLK